MEPMHKVLPWPQVSDELKAHAVSLLVGNYFTNAMLIDHFTLDTWLAHVASILETEIKELAAQYGKELPEIPPPAARICAQTEAHVWLSKRQYFAMETIRRWKTEPSIRERFPSFGDWLIHCETLVAQGIAIHKLQP